MRIGIAGLGRMGLAIGLRLLECGHEVIGWNRTPDRSKPLVVAGGQVAASPMVLAGISDVIVSIVTDRAALAAVYEGPSGVLAADVVGKLVIEMSTVQPADEIALAEKVRARGATFVECPVGGTTMPARRKPRAMRR